MIRLSDTEHAVGAADQRELSEWVSDLVDEANRYDGFEQRLVQRNPLVCSVTISCGMQETEYEAFSRDISPGGIGLITARAVPESTSATLSIERFDGTAIKILSTCRWCSSYGPKWHLSGWEFRRLLGVRRF